MGGGQAREWGLEEKALLKSVEVKREGAINFGLYFFH